MPELGTIVKGDEIGKKDGRHRFIWAKCPTCGVERWAPINNQYSVQTERQCRDCVLGAFHHYEHRAKKEK